MEIHTAGEHVAKVLRKKILCGEIPDKTELTQKLVAAQLGVSRMPIREALNKLELECLVERLGNRHVRVIGSAGKMLTSRVRFMSSVESDAAVCVLENKNLNKDISELRKFSQAKESTENELLFHKKLFILADDRFYYQIYINMIAPLLDIFLHSRGNAAGETFPMLEKIIFAIEKGDSSSIRNNVQQYYNLLLIKMSTEND